MSFNAPYGARCFLTTSAQICFDDADVGLNAPYGARCFLTFQEGVVGRGGSRVLMHLMLLGAF